MSEHRIALRPDTPGGDVLDDVVVRDVSMFRAEMMDDDSLWMCCYFPDSDQRIDFWVRAKKGKLRFTVTDTPHGEGFTYEPQGADS